MVEKRKRPKSVGQAVPAIQRVTGRFWPQIRKQSLLLSLSCLGLVVEIFARLLEPWPMKLIFDRILILDTSANLPPLPVIGGLPAVQLLALLVFCIVAFTGIRAAAAYISLVGMAIAATRILTEIRAEVYSHLQRLSLAFHYKSKSGDLITRITSDIDRLRDVTVTAMLPLGINTLTLVFMAIVMLVVNWQLAFIGFAVFPLFVLTTMQMTGEIHKVAREQRKRESAMASVAAEAMGAIKVVQALSLESMLEHSFSSENQKSLEDSAQSKKLSAGLQRAVEMLVAFATALVVFQGSRLVLQGQATAGDLLVFTTYFKTAFKPTKQLAKQWAQISRAIASGERITDLLDVVPDVRNIKGAIAAPPFQGRVKFEDVHFAYTPEKPILRGLDFEVEPGQRVALVGPSGGGKSTLVSLLLRLYNPASGQISIDGLPIQKYKLQSLRSQISIVLQESVLFGVSVRDNIAYGSLGASDSDIERAALLANAHDFIMDLPEGYDTSLGERGVTLSGGQRQRIAIARAAIRKAPIVILDEPTVGLDNQSEYQVSQALERLTQHCTTFSIAHDLRTVQHCDPIFYIERGQILERGTHAELMQLGQRYAALYQLQCTVERPSLVAASDRS